MLKPEVLIFLLLPSSVAQAEAARSWTPLAILYGSDLDDGEILGAGLGTDGNRVLAGTTRGRALLFDPFSQQELASFTLPDRRYGTSVAIDGDFAVVGNLSDSAFVLDFTDLPNVGTRRLWPEDGTGLDSWFGFSVDIGSDTVIVGGGADYIDGKYNGAVFVFDRDTGNQFAKLTAENGTAVDSFGNSVALDGDLAVVGSSEGTFQGIVHLLDVSRSQLDNRHLARYVASNIGRRGFGYNLDIAGDTIVAVETYGPSLGPAQAFMWPIDEVPQELPGYTAVRNVGDGVSIDGEYAAVGDLYSNRVYLYDLEGDLLAAIDPPEVELLSDFAHLSFGAHVALAGDLLAVNGFGRGNGAVYVYSISQLLVPEPNALCILTLVCLGGLLWRLGHGH